jgi:uncharacterized protein DUF935
MSIWSRIGQLLFRSAVDTVRQQERAHWQEIIKLYGSGQVRLSPFTHNPTEEDAAIRDKYPVLLKEPTIKAAFFTKIFAVASLDLVVQPADKRDPQAKPIAEFVHHALARRGMGTRRIVESLAYGGTIHGFSVSEKVKCVEERGRWKGKVVYRELKPKDVSGNRIMLEVDDYRNVTAVIANHANAGKRVDPADVVLFTYLPLFGSPTGMSDLRAVYRAATLKEAAIKLRMIALDKYTGPYLKGTYTGDDVRSYLETALSKARADGYITLPEGANVEVIDLAVRGTSDFKAAIDDFDKEMLIGLHGAFLHVLEGQTNNGAGDTSVHRTTSELFQWYLTGLVVDAINEQLVPELVDLNFPGTPDYPMVSLGGVNPREILDELAIDEKLHTMGLPLSKEQLYEKSQRQPPASPEDTLAGATGLMGGLPGQEPAGDPFGTDTGAGVGAGAADAGAAGSADLRATVGGSQAIAELQRAFYAGELLREAAIANAVMVFGFTPEEAESLFPVGTPVKTAPPEDAPATTAPGGGAVVAPFRG